MIGSPLKTAADLLERIRAGDVEHGTKTREIWRKGWSGMSSAEELASVIDVLEEHGWARREKVKPAGPGRPSERLLLHPELRE